MQSKKTIRVCDKCNKPMIWTFVFDYYERYCLNCGNKGGMLGTGRDILATRELIFQKKIVDALWKIIYGKKALLSSGRFVKYKCKKDNGSCKDHRQHLAKSEKEWDKIARKYMEHFEKGFINLTNK